MYSFNGAIVALALTGATLALSTPQPPRSASAFTSAASASVSTSAMSPMVTLTATGYNGHHWHAGRDRLKVAATTEPRIATNIMTTATIAIRTKAGIASDRDWHRQS